MSKFDPTVEVQDSETLLYISLDNEELAKMPNGKISIGGFQPSSECGENMET
jgi:hypothetical protein